MIECIDIEDKFRCIYCGELLGARMESSYCSDACAANDDLDHCEEFNYRISIIKAEVCKDVTGN